MAGVTTVRDDALELSTDQGGNHGGQGDSGHNIGGDYGERHSRPVPSFWNFVENELSHEHANNNHHQFEPMRHHA
jgi:hypothetical protein